MKTDPRAACANTEENLLWSLIHDGIAHPFMAVTNYSRVSLRFHDWTSLLAWPRVAPPKAGEWMTVRSTRWERVTLQVREESLPGFYAVKCPFLKTHTTVVKAFDVVDAAEQAEVWFSHLLDEPVVCSHLWTKPVDPRLNNGMTVVCRFCPSHMVDDVWRRYA